MTVRDEKVDKTNGAVGGDASATGGDPMGGEDGGGEDGGGEDGGGEDGGGEDGEGEDGGGEDGGDEGEPSLWGVGIACSDGAQCATGFCHDAVFGGAVCSDCGENADCVAAGTGINCTQLAIGPNNPYFTCSDGALGESCDADDGCAEGNYCGEVFQGLGRKTCGECADSSHCTDGDKTLCVFVDVVGPGGGGGGGGPAGNGFYLQCVVPGFLADGNVCDAEGELAKGTAWSYPMMKGWRCVATAGPTRMTVRRARCASLHP